MKNEKLWELTMLVRNAINAQSNFFPGTVSPIVFLLPIGPIITRMTGITVYFQRGPAAGLITSAKSLKL